MLTVKGKRDYELILKAKNGDERAFEQLMNLYSKNIFFEIQKLVRNQEEANDLMMESMAKAFQQLESYEPTYAFSTWLKRVCVNHTIDSLRKRKLDMVSLDIIQDGDREASGIEFATEDLNPLQAIEAQEKVVAVRAFVSQLKERYKELITLRYFEELSYVEIAEQTALPVGTVKARLHRAKGMLKDIMVGSSALAMSY